MTTVGAAVIYLASSQVQRVELHVPGIGPWVADVDLMDATAIPSGRQTLTIGDTKLVGTVVDIQSGTFGDQRRVRLVGGGAGWGNVLPSKGYHNDAGIKARTILEDAARESGETLDAAAGGTGKVGASYVRRTGPASNVVRYVSPSWWVGYDGKTYTGKRTKVTPTRGSYEVLKYAPRDRTVELSFDSLAAIPVGAVLSERLDTPQTIGELRVVADGEKLRAWAWTGADTDTSGRLQRAMKSVVTQAQGAGLWGLYSYRVISMSSPRVKLQATTNVAGLPNILPCEQHPGASGWHAELAVGAEVLVQFVNGDAARPVITNYPGKGQGGHVPSSVSICGGTQPIARQGDGTMSGGITTQLLFTAAVGDFTTKTAMQTGVPYFMYSQAAPPGTPVPIPYLPGVVSTGNPRVKG